MAKQSTTGKQDAGKKETPAKLSGCDIDMREEPTPDHELPVTSGGVEETDVGED
jgi:hypothetical protein